MQLAAVGSLLIYLAVAQLAMHIQLTTSPNSPLAIFFVEKTRSKYLRKIDVEIEYNLRL